VTKNLQLIAEDVMPRVRGRQPARARTPLRDGLTRTIAWYRDAVQAHAR
jgi:hypothetical protein